MVLFLQKDKEIIKIYSHSDGRTIMFEPRIGASYSMHVNDFQNEYTNLLSQGFINVTNKYFMYLVKAPGNYCIIEDVNLDGSLFSVKNSIGASFTCGAESAKRTYEEKVQDGYIDITHTYDEYGKTHGYGQQSLQESQEETYMFGLDHFIDQLPYPESYKKAVFGHFRK